MAREDLRQAAFELLEQGAPAYVEIEPPPKPDLTGDILADSVTLTGLDQAEIEELRSIDPGAPEKLYRIGMALYGGLGSEGVRLWLEHSTAHLKPRLDHFRAGHGDKVVAEADRYYSSMGT